MRSFDAPVDEGRLLGTLDEHFGDWAILPLSAHPGVIRIKASPDDNGEHPCASAAVPRKGRGSGLSQPTGHRAVCGRSLDPYLLVAAPISNTDPLSSSRYRGKPKFRPSTASTATRKRPGSTTPAASPRPATSRASKRNSSHAIRNLRGRIGSRRIDVRLRPRRSSSSSINLDIRVLGRIVRAQLQSSS